MKKLLLASAIALSISAGIITLSNMQIEANAKVDKNGYDWYEMKPNFASSLKKGTMPYAKGKVGMTYDVLSKKAPMDHIDFYNGFVYYSHERAKNDFDEYIFTKSSFNSKSKVKMIHRSYDYLITEKSIRKYFGKPVKTMNFGGEFGRYMYKSGKYYMNVTIYSESGYDATIFSLGTKATIKKDFNN